MNAPLRKLPIDIQTFEKIRRGGYDGRTLLKAGVSFDAAERNIGVWKVVNSLGK